MNVEYLFIILIITHFALHLTTLCKLSKYSMSLGDLIYLNERKRCDNLSIPNFVPSFEDLSKQMRINQKIILQEISEHTNKEIERIKKEIENAN